MGVQRRIRSHHEEIALREREAELLRGEPTRRQGHRNRADLVQLHLCPECDSELVFPTAWSPVGQREWRVELRCPECEWRGGGVHDQEVVDRFDRVLDDGTEALLDDFTRLMRANLEEELQRFAAALHRDLVLPEDF
jgi:hypothetical protein